MILGGEIGSERLVGGSERVGMMGGEGKSGRKANGGDNQTARRKGLWYGK